MNTQLFDQATISYDNKDYRGALRAYTACLQDTSTPFALGEIGLIYHRIGNCLVKLKNPAEAIQAYAQSAADPAYSAKGALQNNIGMAYASLRDYENAVKHFEQAVEDPAYETPYKAYMGLGNAELKLGRSAEAGVAFREAALDEGNPDPAKALLNLGICFMALDRPADAIASYQSALQFDMTPDTSNRLNASMGQALAANSQMEEAVEAFERAIADGTYILSDSASVDYQRALNAVAQSRALETAGDMSGLDVSATGDGLYEVDNDPFFYDEEYDPSVEQSVYFEAYQGDEDKFFEASEEEIVQISKGLAKKDRKRRNIGLKFLVVIIVLIILMLGTAVFGYFQGYGWPTQQAVTEQLFADPDNAYENVFVDTLSKENVDSMMNSVIQDPDVAIDGVNRSMTESVVFATATTAQGAKITYEIDMVRDMIGWKVTSVELYFPSLAS